MNSLIAESNKTFLQLEVENFKQKMKTQVFNLLEAKIATSLRIRQRRNSKRKERICCRRNTASYGGWGGDGGGRSTEAEHFCEGFVFDVRLSAAFCI